MQDILDRLADQVLDLDADDLKALLPRIQARMDLQDQSREWERAVIGFFIINALRVKDTLAAKGLARGFHQPAPGEQRLRLVK